MTVGKGFLFYFPRLNSYDAANGRKIPRLPANTPSHSRGWLIAEFRRLSRHGVAAVFSRGARAIPRNLRSRQLVLISLFVATSATG